jgi:hypothetical protein
MSPADRINRITRNLLLAYFPECAGLAGFFAVMIFAACVFGGSQ